MQCIVVFANKKRDRKSKNKQKMSLENAVRDDETARDDLLSYIVPRWSDAKADVSAGPRTEQLIGCCINRRVSVVRSSRALHGDRVVYK